MQKFNAMLTPLILLCLSIILSGCESGRDNENAQKIRVGVIESTLIKHKVCSDLKDCVRRYNAHYHVSNGVVWEIYSVGNRRIINDVLSNMLAFSNQLPRDKTFSISFYSVSEQEVGFFDKPIAQLVIQGEQ